MKKDYRLCAFWVVTWLSLSVLSPVSARQPDCLKQNPSVSQRILSDKRMDDKQQIEALYKQMYRAMIAKDTATLGSLLDEKSVLIHMTGTRQPKHDYLRAIKDGTLNYYSVEDDEIIIEVNGDKATMTGRSRVNAAVYGGGRHTWRLQIKSTVVKKEGRWLFVEQRASTY